MRRLKGFLSAVAVGTLLAAAVTVNWPALGQTAIRVFGTVSGAPIPLAADSSGRLQVTVAGGTATPTNTWSDSLCVDVANHDTCFTRAGANSILLGAGASGLLPVFTLGSATSAYPAFRRNSANAELILGDASAYTNLILAGLGWGSPGSGFVRGTAAGVVRFGNAGLTVGTTIQVNTAPTCSSNCGTSPSVSGSDTAGIVTMGASGVPASGWVLSFGSTWPAAPACQVSSALNTMVVGKMPIAIVTTTTNMTVTTNGTAPATSDKYQYICLGSS